MSEIQSQPGLADRRQFLAAMGAGGLALAVTSNRTLAQETPDYSDHPLTGMWLAMANPGLPDSPQFPAPSLYTAEGYVVLQFPPIDAKPDGPVIQSILLGVWEPYDERTGHFTAVQSLSALDGSLIGTVTIDGYPRVEDDNMHFIDDNSLAHVVIRDTTGAIIQDIPPGSDIPPVTATRMMVGASGLPSADEATPTARTATLT